MNETPDETQPHYAVGVARLLLVADAAQRAVGHAPHADVPADLRADDEVLVRRVADGTGDGFVGEEDAVGVVGDLLVPEGEVAVGLEGLRGIEIGGSHLGERGVIGEEEEGVLEGGYGDGGDGVLVHDVEGVLLGERELIGMMLRHAHDVLLLQLLRIRTDVVLLDVTAKSSIHHEIAFLHLSEGSLHDSHRVADSVALQVVLDLLQTILIVQHSDAYSFSLNDRRYASLSLLWNS